MKPIVYILFSRKLDRYYIGFTADLDTRMTFHKQSKSGKFTSKADDWELFLQIDCKSRIQALAIERHIKRMKSKIYIQNLKRYPEIIDKLKDKY